MSAHLTSAAHCAEGYDLLVVGAGAAGLSAAAVAAEAGLSVLVLDENPAPGGQIYRGIGGAGAADLARLGPDYASGGKILARFQRCGVAYAPRALVWGIGPTDSETGGDWPLQLGLSLGGAAREIGARRVVLATGALERPMPIPGWTLPGVMTAGAAQIALKTAGLVPSGRVVMAGTGPLLYLLAAQLLGAGAQLSAIVDTTPPAQLRAAVPHVLPFLISSYGRKGATLLWQVMRRVRILRGATALEVQGDGRAEGLAVTRGGATKTLAADLVLLHQGVTPNLNLTIAAGCATTWNDARAAFEPVRDARLDSSVAGIAIAGDAGGIVGAQASAVEGEIAGVSAAMHCGRLADGDARLASLRRAHARALRGRAFLDTLYRPADRFRVPERDDTLVCRCEEITAGRLRETAVLGVQGPNQMKAFLRCGMGPCQGRLCGLTVSEMIAQTRGVSPDDVGYYRLRPPIKPVPLSELAALPTTEAAVIAVAGFVETPPVS